MGYSDFPNEWVEFCYIHAQEASLVELPLRQLRDLKERIAYPENAIAFVLEALLCADAIVTADDVVEVVVRNGVDRFQTMSTSVLNGWGIRDRGDIGRIAIGLQRSRLAQLPAALLQEQFSGALHVAELRRIQYELPGYFEMEGKTVAEFSFAGNYPVGTSPGNKEGAAMRQYIAKALEQQDADALVFDLDGLRYRGGDTINQAFLPLLRIEEPVPIQRPAAIFAQPETCRWLISWFEVSQMLSVGVFEERQVALDYIGDRLRE